jgi:hypothetical protein
MVDMGEQQRVRETRMFLQVATSPKFVCAVEETLYRKVRAFASATDPMPPSCSKSSRSSRSSRAARMTAADLSRTPLVRDL